MARTLPDSDQDWSAVDRREEPPEQVRLPAWGWLAAAFGLAFWLRGPLAGLVDGPALGTWTTVFVSISVQALPFLVLGVVVSGAIAALVPPGWLAKALPDQPLVAVPAAGLAGVALPGCECGAVPIAGRLTARGAPTAAALAFMLAAPAINPVVLVSTAVAFPGRPEVVAARFVASLVTAVAVGLLWARVGREAWIDRDRRRIIEAETRWRSFTQTALHDFLHAGGWLVIEAMAAASLQVAVPRSVLDAVAGHQVLAVVALAGLAVVLAVCSEADAFVAASLSQFSLTARLVFMVVGPVVDLSWWRCRPGCSAAASPSGSPL
jgi:uncharacterized membrane protein YraQ (UPF0718 family)